MLGDEASLRSNTRRKESHLGRNISHKQVRTFVYILINKLYVLSFNKDIMTTAQYTMNILHVPSNKICYGVPGLL